MKLAVFALLAAAVLLFGCTYPQVPQQGAQQNGQITTPPQQNELTGTGAQPQEEQEVVEVPAEKQYTCALELSPPTIYAGDSTDITFAVSTKDDVEFTYNCGEEGELGISTGGLTSGSRLCQFKTAGEQQVWIKADGKICAQKTLTVLSAEFKPRNCSVNLTKKDLQDYYYEMLVEFDGFMPGDNITWKCGYTIAKKPIAGDPSFGMPRYEIISCDFNTRPPYDTIIVSVADVVCGEISTR